MAATSFGATLGAAIVAGALSAGTFGYTWMVNDKAEDTMHENAVQEQRIEVLEKKQDEIYGDVKVIRSWVDKQIGASSNDNGRH